MTCEELVVWVTCTGCKFRQSTCCRYFSTPYCLVKLGSIQRSNESNDLCFGGFHFLFAIHALGSHRRFIQNHWPCWFPTCAGIFPSISGNFEPITYCFVFVTCVYIPGGIPSHDITYCSLPCGSGSMTTEVAMLFDLTCGPTQVLHWYFFESTQTTSKENSVRCPGNLFLSRVFRSL